MRVGVEKEGDGGKYRIRLQPSSSSSVENQTHEVFLVHYDPRTLTVSIPRGENAGRTLPHKNIVKSLIRLGTWTPSQSHNEAESTFSFDVAQAGHGDAKAVGEGVELKTAVLVQRGRGGPIVGAAKILA